MVWQTTDRIVSDLYDLSGLFHDPETGNAPAFPRHFRSMVLHIEPAILKRAGKGKAYEPAEYAGHGAQHQMTRFSGGRFSVTEKVENLILEQLKSLRNEVKDLRRDMDNNFRDVKLRLGSIERYQVGSHDDLVR